MMARVNQSPKTTLATVGTGSMLAIAYNGDRRSIAFHNPSTTASIYFVTDEVSAVVGTGILLGPGETFTIAGNDRENTRVTAGFNAIATAANSPLTILEFI